jgi:hypothetical protein
MREKARGGWHWGPADDEKKKLHACMLPRKTNDLEPYAGFLDHLGTTELPEDEKDKDRVAVHNIPRILKSGGYTIVPPARKPAVTGADGELKLNTEFPATVIIHPTAP